MPSHIKCNNLNGLSRFTVEPLLPAGLQIDVNTGDIRGIATVKTDAINYKITFDRNGITTSTYLSIMTGYLEKGLYVTYYKTSPVDDKCQDTLEALANTVVTEKIIRIEKTINYTYLSEKWYGLTDEFDNYYEAKFEGYIFFDETKRLNHKIVCDGACWVRINEGEIKFDLSVVGKEQYPHIGQNNVDEYEGYSKFSINYRDCKNEQKLLYFLIGEDDHQLVLPYFYFVPTNAIIYTYQLYTLKQYSNYPVNSPIIVNSMINSRNIVSYQLHNTILRGLVLNSVTGIISGSPIENTNGITRDIKVNAYLDDGSIIEINVEINVQEESGIGLIDLKSSAALTNPAELTLGEDFELEIYSDKPSTKKEMSGNLPSNLQFDKENGKIIGTVLQSGEFDIEVAIQSPTVRAIERKKYKLIIPACRSSDMSYEDKINSHFTQIIITTDTILPQKLQVVLYNKGMSKIIDSLLTETPYKADACTRNGIYFIEIVDAIYSYYNIYINITVDGYTLYSFSIPGSNSNSMNINNKRSFKLDLRLIKPIISYPVNEIDWELFDTSEITPTITGSILYFTITPSILPNDIYFNTTTGVISGTATTLFSDTIYTITATNALGNSEQFTITFKSHSSSCENNENSLLHIYISTSIFPEYMSIVIENSKSGELVYVLNNDNIYSQVSDHFNLKNSEYNKYICVTQDEYKVTYTSTHPNKLGWKRGYIMIYLYNIGLGRYTVNDDDEGRIFTLNLNLVFTVDSLSKWEYSTVYNSLWTTEKNINWKSEVISQIEDDDVEKENNILYLRKIVNLNKNILKSPAFYIQIQFTSGFIIYINGEEIFKKLDNNNNRNLFMMTSSDVLKSFSFLFPIAMLSNNNETVISIELHKSEDEENFQKFHFVLIELFANNNYTTEIPEQMCVNINSIGKSKIMNAYPEMKYGLKGVYNAFDNDNSIGWRDKLPNDGVYNKYPWVEYSFGDNNYYFINKLVITSNNIQGGNYVENPKDVIVEGYDEVLDEWNYLGNIENIETKISYQKNNITFYRNSRLYNRIRINITSLNQYNEDNIYFQVTNIGLFVCDKYYCDETDRLPYTDGDNSVRIECNNNNNNNNNNNITTNFDEFYCPYTKDPKWLQINSTCEESPHILDVIEKYVYYVGKDEGVVEYFKASGYINKVTVYPDLPLGLVEVTPGKYKGIVYTEYLLRSYLFTASNDYGYFNAVVQIEVVSPTEPNIIDYIDSYQLYQYVEVKSLIMVFALGVDLYYEIKPKLPDGLTLNPFTGSISGISTKSFSKIDFDMIIHYDNDNILTKKISLECISSEYPSIISQEREYVFYVNENYTNLSLFKVAGSNLKYSVDQALPNGLTLNSNGYISGKCTEINENPTLYIFTISNTEGVVSINIYLTFIEATIPQFISIETEDIFLIGIEVNDVKIFQGVGQNISYSIHPELPAGLSFNKNTGLISGKPLEESYVKLYTITISSNKDIKSVERTSLSSLSVTKDIIMGIKYSEKSILLNSKQTNIFYKNVELSRDYVLVSSIGYNIRYILNSPLPSGLSFSETTGVLSGMPLQEDSLKSYNITVQSTNQNNNEINNENVTVTIEVKVLYCKKDGRWPVTEMGEKVSLSCTGTKSGNMYRNCVMNEMNILQPMWESTVDNCRISTDLMTICIVIVVVVLAILFFLIVICFIKHHPIQPLE